MNLRHVVSCGLVCAALLLTGCDDGRTAPGRVSLQVANAAPGFEALTFRREQDARAEASLLFKGAQAFVYDADTYDFYVVERTLNINDPGRTWQLTTTLEADTNYTVVLSEVAGEVVPVLLPSAAAPATDAQILALNATSGSPAMDLYLERAGVGIAGATPRGTLGSQQQLSARTLPSGDYELFLTTAGNPADVLLASQAFNLLAGTTSTIVIVPEGGLGTAPLSVLLMNTTPINLIDKNAPSEMRAINAATDRVPRDVAVDSQFSPPLFSATEFGVPTAYAPIPIGAVKINVTPVGNSGVLEADANVAGVVGQRATMLFNGPAGTLVPLFVADDGRRFVREARMRFMNAATQFLGIDFVITLPDGDPATVPTQATLLQPGIAGYTPLYPGDYDLYLYLAGTPTVLSGPTRISVAPGGLYGVLAVDGPDTATATPLLLDDFAP